jgi:hypothetical protein
VDPEPIVKPLGSKLRPRVQGLPPFSDAVLSCGYGIWCACGRLDVVGPTLSDPVSSKRGVRLRERSHQRRDRQTKSSRLSWRPHHGSRWRPPPNCRGCQHPKQKGWCSGRCRSPDRPQPAARTTAWADRSSGHSRARRWTANETRAARARQIPRPLAILRHGKIRSSQPWRRGAGVLRRVSPRDAHDRQRRWHAPRDGRWIYVRTGIGHRQGDHVGGRLEGSPCRWTGCVASCDLLRRRREVAHALWHCLDNQ